MGPLSSSGGVCEGVEIPNFHLIWTLNLVLGKKQDIGDLLLSENRRFSEIRKNGN